MNAFTQFSFCFTVRAYSYKSSPEVRRTSNLYAQKVPHSFCSAWVSFKLVLKSVTLKISLINQTRSGLLSGPIALVSFPLCKFSSYHLFSCLGLILKSSCSVVDLGILLRYPAFIESVSLSGTDVSFISSLP